MPTLMIRKGREAKASFFSPSSPKIGTVSVPPPQAWKRCWSMAPSPPPLWLHILPTSTWGSPLCIHILLPWSWGNPLCMHICLPRSWGSPLCMHISLPPTWGGPICMHICLPWSWGGPLCMHSSPTQPNGSLAGSHSPTATGGGRGLSYHFTWFFKHCSKFLTHSSSAYWPTLYL
jgi:hypothetical protein